MKKIIAIQIMLYLFLVSSHAQNWNVKTSATLWATATPNIELGYALNKHVTLHVPIQYNPFVFGDNSRFQQLSTMPGARYWFSRSHVGAFVSAYAIVSRFHVGGWFDQKYRYDGKGFGGGIGAGYSWILTKRLNIECEGGIGLIHADYDKCGWRKDSRLYAHIKGIRVIPAKLDVSIVYFF